MRVSILDLHCLNAISDDYETIASIIEDVRRSSHGNVDAVDVAACMMDLVREGLVDAFRFEPTKEQYVRCILDQDRLPTTWFRINEQGRRQLDEHWVDD